MRRFAIPLIALGLLAACAASIQEQRASLDNVAKALGATEVRSLEYTGAGTHYQLGQSATPGRAYPRFNLPSYTRSINYDTASLQDVIVRTQAENPPRGGGGQPIRGELRQVFVVSGEHSWNVVNDAPVPSPITLADRQLQLWTTPHGFIKAALARGASVSGRTISLAVPGRYNARGTFNAEGGSSNGSKRSSPIPCSATCRSRSPTPSTARSDLSSSPRASASGLAASPPSSSRCPM
jgi:hypothetical protein